MDAQTFTQKLGPLPVWVWGIIAGGAYYFYSSRSKVSAAGSTTTSGANGATGVGTGLGGNDLVGQGPGGWTYSYPGASTTPTIAPTDNASWGVAAENYLLGKNYDPSLVDGAIRNYLAGNSVTAEQWTILGQALQGIGAAPELLPPTDSGVLSNAIVPVDTPVSTPLTSTTVAPVTTNPTVTTPAPTVSKPVYTPTNPPPGEAYWTGHGFYKTSNIPKTAKGVIGFHYVANHGWVHN